MMEQLRTSIKNKEIILFVGAGISMNLKLPSWDQLVNNIAGELGYDPAIAKALGNPLALAEYYRIMTGSIGPLRSWMDREWHSDSINIKDSKIHELLVSLDFPLIYTTNYDRWLERAHEAYGRPYTKIAAVADITKVKGGETQIIKFHGDFDHENSIVLDESSYFERLDFEGPLDIKLRSDVLGKGVLFLGYSLSDINIRLLFFKLSKLWKNSLLAGKRPQSYIFSSRPNPVQEAIFDQWGIKMINSEKDNANEAVEEFLRELNS